MKNFGIDKIQNKVTAENLTLGEIVRQAREKHHYTHEYLAKKIGISSAPLVLTEKNESILRLKTLHKLAEVLKIDLTTLLVVAGYIKSEPQNVGELVYVARILDNLTQTDLARKSEITRKRLRDLEKGKRKVSVKVLKMLSFSLTSVTFEELLEMAGCVSEEKTLSAKIQNAISREGLTVNEVSNATGLCDETISNLLSIPKHKPHKKTLFKLAKCLQLDYEELKNLPLI